MSYFLCGTVVAVVVCALPSFSQELGEPMATGIMLGRMMSKVGVMVSQVVEHHLSGCHLVIITSSCDSPVTSTILRVAGTRVIVAVESFFIHEPQPPMDNPLQDSSAATPQSPSWQHVSQKRSYVDPLRQHQTPQDQLSVDNLLQGLWGDSRTTCRGLILDLTSSRNTTHLALRLVEMSGLWRLPETVVIAIGGRAGVRAVLLHHSLRNTVHALYLALHHDLNLALHHTSLHVLHHASLHAPLQLNYLSLWKPFVNLASTNSGVRVYRRCLYSNNGEADVQIVHNLNINSLDLPWDDLLQERFQNFMGHKMRIVTATVVSPYLDYQRVSEAPGTAVMLVDSLDTRLIYTFADKLNFTFDVHEAVNRTWGVEINGTFTGSIGLLQREEMDFTTLTAPTAKRTKVVEFFIAYPSDTFTITSLKPTLLPKYLALIRPFEGVTIVSLGKEIEPIPSSHVEPQHGSMFKNNELAARATTTIYTLTPLKVYLERSQGKLWVALLVSVVGWGVILWLLQRAWQWVAGGRPVALNTTILYAWGALLQNLPSEPSASLAGKP
nr:uncharacterized protein LOC123749451 [Procambarus clarkii]